MPLKVNIRHLESDEVELKGELPAGELGLDSPDELIRAQRPLRYNLKAQKTGRDVLVQGRLEIDLDCECARCLKPFRYKVKLEHWATHIALEGPEKAEIKDDCVDLTPYLREDILLEYPQHPLCDADCAGLPNRAGNKSAKQKKGGGQTSESSAWSELNKLKF